MSDSKVPEFEPPQACIARIMKNALPENVQVTKDARAAFTRAAGIFIFYLTNCANEFSRDAKRQTITTNDVLNALKELEFDDFEQPLAEFLEKYRKSFHDAKKVVKNKKDASGTDAGGDADADADGDADMDGAEKDEEEEEEEEVDVEGAGEGEGGELSADLDANGDEAEPADEQEIDQEAAAEDGGGDGEDNEEMEEEEDS